MKTVTREDINKELLERRKVLVKRIQDHYDEKEPIAFDLYSNEELEALSLILSEL